MLYMATLLGGKGGGEALQLEIKRLFWSTYVELPILVPITIVNV